jgi:hypothetical protein
MIQDAKNNISAFNDYVNDQMNTLATRSKTSSNITVNLIRGSMTCTDNKFVEYREKCKDNNEEGENITYQSLLEKAERKYQAPTLNGEWNVPTQEQKEIIALKATLASWNQSKPKKEAGWNLPEKNFKQVRKPEQVHTKGIFKVTQSCRNIRPQAYKSQTKVINGSTWHYCVHHQAWGRHRTKKCLKGRKDGNHVNLEASLAHIGVKDIMQNPM